MLGWFTKSTSEVLCIALVCKPIASLTLSCSKSKWFHECVCYCSASSNSFIASEAICAITFPSSNMIPPPTA